MCPNEAHVHPVTAVLVPFVGWMTVDEQRDVFILTTDQTVADRLAVLINRHGLADVPDDASALTPPQPGSWLARTVRAARRSATRRTPTRPNQGVTP